MPNRLLILIVLFNVATIGAGLADRLKDELAWPFVASSSLIVTGDLSLPQKGKIGRSVGNLPWVELGLTNIAILKGEFSQEKVIKSAPGSEQLIVFLGSDDRFIKPKLKRINGKRVVCFLNKWEHGYYYHVRDEGLSIFVTEGRQISQLKEEIRKQDDIATHFMQRFRNEASQCSHVIELLDQLGSENSFHYETFSQILKLGTNAIPCLVYNMDDARPLVNESFDTPGLPHSFEGIYHCGARNRIEACDLLLNRIAHQHPVDFSVPDGEVDRHLVYAWRVYFAKTFGGKAEAPAK